MHTTSPRTNERRRDHVGGLHHWRHLAHVAARHRVVFGIDQPRETRLDAHSGVTEFAGEGIRKCQDERLRASIGGAVRQRVGRQRTTEGEERSDVHDSTFAASDHARNGGAGKPRHRADVDTGQLIDDPGLDFDEGPIAAEAGVVDQKPEPLVCGNPRFIGRIGVSRGTISRLTLARVAARLTDKRVLKLIRAFLNAGVMEDGLVRPVDEGK
jgi:hypothetical protein